jgi:hypothetical protein
MRHVYLDEVVPDVADLVVVEIASRGLLLDRNLAAADPAKTSQNG